jgi:hypothetical protein
MAHAARNSCIAILFATAVLPISFANAQMPESIAAPGEMLAVTVHAEGVQIYECKTDAAGKLLWQFREPVATLMEGGKTVGVHYAGPSWQMVDGSTVAAKVTGRALGASDRDIPLLKLEVTAQRGEGRLTDVITVQRLNTKGGVAEGACDKSGALFNVPYSADYAFLRKAP